MLLAAAAYSPGWEKFFENLFFTAVGLSKFGAPVSVIYYGLEAFYDGGANQAAKDLQDWIGNHAGTDVPKITWIHQSNILRS